MLAYSVLFALIALTRISLPPHSPQAIFLYGRLFSTIRYYARQFSAFESGQIMTIGFV